MVIEDYNGTTERRLETNQDIDNRETMVSFKQALRFTDNQLENSKVAKSKMMLVSINDGGFQNNQ